jgi:hypothetical protein
MSFDGIGNSRYLKKETAGRRSIDLDSMAGGSLIGIHGYWMT